MQRIIFERSVCDGFRTSKVESIANSTEGKKLFVGTNDGLLVLYECRQDSSSLGRTYGCKLSETLRKQSKDKKPTGNLICVESWRVILGIIDGIVMAYDSHFYQLLGSINESKGCHLLAVNEKASSIVVANKKKLTSYNWQSPGFMLHREYNLIDIPKSINYIQGSVVIGYKKFYECIDINTGSASRILDIEKEHKMIIAEFERNEARDDCILLSMGTQGVFLSLVGVLSGASFAYGSHNEERIEWFSYPISVKVMNPFILSVLNDSSIEIHDLASLTSLQRISIASPSPHILSLDICCEIHPSTSLNGFSYHAFVCNGEQLSVLKLIPLATQVENLKASGSYEEAINMVRVCNNPALLDGIDTATLYEANANALITKGDFQKAIDNFINAKSDFLIVAACFPDFVPQSLQTLHNITQPKKLTGSVLQRAAAAVVNFCEHYREKFAKKAETAEKNKDSGVLGISSSIRTPNLRNPFGNPFTEDEDDEYLSDPDAIIKRAQLLDTMYLFALMNCSPDRKQAVIELLASPNRCQIESCSVLLASHGNAYTEALLWLYRSQHQHSRVLQALSEDKCVAQGAWSRDQFYNWTADYLRWLWYNEDPSLPRQALSALKPLLEYDAELGLSVLVCRPNSKSSFGGKGVTISEVLTFLRSTSPKINYTRTSLSFSTNFATNTQAMSKLDEKNSIWQNDKGIATVIASTPLINGRALGVAFLECLVSSGEAPANMHDEFAQLLIEGLPMDSELHNINHFLNDLELKTDDSETLMLYKIYRRKLQNFLCHSSDYHPQRVLKILPRTYLHENALVLSKLGRHREVLKIYLIQLKNLELSELYCLRLYNCMMGKDINHELQMISPLNIRTKVNIKQYSNIYYNTVTTPINLQNPGEIYLILFQVILEDNNSSDEESSSEKLQEISASSGNLANVFNLEWSLKRSKTRLQLIIKLAEKYFERFDTNSLLELLPPNTPIAQLLQYFQIVIEHKTSNKRNLQIIHQLLRLREVSVRVTNIQNPTSPINLNNNNSNNKSNTTPSYLSYVPTITPSVSSFSFNSSR